MPHGVQPNDEGLTPALLMHAYSVGVFPMSEHRDDPEIFWVDPHQRGIFPLDAFHVSKSLSKALRKRPFRISLNENFLGVVDGCADREETWINAEIRDLYQSLHQLGCAHSLEVWEDTMLVGGVYGVTLGSAFFGESMFSKRTNASKIALAYLCAHLRNCGFTLFDTQFITPHLASLGAIEISRASYHALLADAVRGTADITGIQLPSAEDAVLQRRTQTS
ncbi:leucyl/phenylalanyl-tRNA--protein transferase [Shimia thalassica]|uniref:leucyl/phenylalanyl-tRNA--protein transferase n=1 Tax=Shimia thalassica TaxID=1715693 RepID=UPI0026E1F323|nr:leucyl/phenylalanyl-tRNA--protein transferase [Shimia thalassica]MDO6482481.1 leucyl/phenylalanyl-tRNA--protein transferase [Shimia thalassica]